MKANHSIGDQKYSDLEGNEGTVSESSVFNDINRVVCFFNRTVGEGKGHGVANAVFVIKQGPDSLFHKAGNMIAGIVTGNEESA